MQQWLDIAAELPFVGLGLDDHIAAASIEIELAVGAGKIVEPAQLDACGAQAKLEILEVAQGVEGGGGFELGMVEQ
ncbi:hypothetical protein D9M73_270570 [compost metagenome]